MTLELVSHAACFGGDQRVYAHQSTSTGTRMEIGVFVPPQALEGEDCPALVYLSGLTCTWENVTTKAGAQRICSELGVIFIAPDTSPRGDDVADDASYDLGKGAGFYVNATQAPWTPHYRMYDYVAVELLDAVAGAVPFDQEHIGLTGHSMGGHGALTIAMNNPALFRSVSAFAPIVSPMSCPWGEKALTAYLGDDRSTWAPHDACALMRKRGWRGEILIDQGDQDPFLQNQLKPHLFGDACDAAGVPLTLRMQAGYDHSYYFIQTFMEDHIRWFLEHGGE